jgi:hypothetical protein
MTAQPAWLHRVFDAAYPPPVPPEGTAAVMGYIGGPRAYHTWTPQQWRPFAHLRQFPVYAADVSRSPAAQAAEAARLAIELGWDHRLTGAEQRAIVLDLETSTSAAWYAEAARILTEQGFVAVAYGSLSTVLGNAASDVLAAEWDDLAVIPPGQTIHGKQDQANVNYMSTVVDYSVFDDWLYLRGGVGLRHGA